MYTVGVLCNHRVMTWVAEWLPGLQSGCLGCRQELSEGA